MIDRNTQIIFTLSFDFINMPKTIQILSEFFSIDPNQDYEEQINKLCDLVYTKLGKKYHDNIFLNTTDYFKNLNNKIIPNDCAEIYRADDFTMSIRLGSNYQNISLDNCLHPQYCYTLVIESPKKQVIYDFIDILIYDGDSINYTIKPIYIRTNTDSEENAEVNE